MNCPGHYHDSSYGKEIIMAKKVRANWTLDGVHKSIPLVCSILHTIRDGVIQVNSLELRLIKINKKFGRPTREEIIEVTNLKNQVDKLKQEVCEAADELTELGVMCTDPIRATAAFPFVTESEIGPVDSYYEFDMFNNTVQAKNT
jgi:hypothetical protein